MYRVFKTARLSGMVVLAVAGATMLSVGACSSAHDQHDQPASAGSSPKAVKSKPETSIRGLVTSVSGNAAQVAAKGGPVTVDLGPSTKVVEFNAIQLTDVVAGDCVNAFHGAAAPSNGDFTAKTVQLVPQDDHGKCAQQKPTPEKVTGTVASVAGNTINVTVDDGSGKPAPTAVMVSDITNYTKGTKATSQVIVEGKCLSGRGTKDDDGKLQATFVSVGNPPEGECS